jgi:transmembrane sensor
MTKNDKALEEAVAWHVLASSGTPDQDEADRFTLWLAKPGNQEAYDHVSRTWDMFSHLPRPSLQEQPLAGCPRPSRSAWLRGGYAVAASIALLLLFSGIVALDVPTRLVADAMTATGTTRAVRLDDGSIVTLNTASAIEVLYAPNERRIRLLKGEALMDVMPNPSRPFIVEADGGTTRALGTVWSVQLDGRGVTATVLEGHVAVQAPAGMTGSVTLSVGQRVRYDRSGLGRTTEVDADMETAWRRGKLIFVDKPLGEVVAELNRYHSGRIQIADPRLSRRVVSGVFDLRDPFGTLDSIEKSLGVKSLRLSDVLILLYG